MKDTLHRMATHQAKATPAQAPKAPPAAPAPKQSGLDKRMVAERAKIAGSS